ncbi:hypothetical protein [Lysobacter panacisoli]|uniref:Uncharacterized protein n=1 Tax=Lysobacter panacisoli TaxID=1255263 RepID=A0ABP9LC43_9GAMM|nr:hypothetical protein [Lysobacter panacisoli]
MPIKRVQFPDGSIKRVEVPEGATNEQIIAFVQSQHAQPKAAPKQAGNRTAQLAGRSVTQGAAGTLDMIDQSVKSLPGMSLFKFATNRLPTIREAAQAFLTSRDVARPETRGERIASDVGEAVTGAALTGGAGVASGVRALGANPVMQAISAATGAGAASYAKEEGASPLVQSLLGLAGGLAPGAARYTAAAGARGVTRGGEAGRQRVQSNIADFEAAGTTPTVGQATEGRLARALESALARTPGAAGVMAGKSEQQAAQIGSRLGQMANELSPRADAVTAGRAIQRGVAGSADDTFASRTGATSNALYRRLDQAMPQGNIPVANAGATIADLNPEIVGAPALSPLFQNARLRGIQEAFGKDATPASQGLGGPVSQRLPYEGVSKLRTLVGKEVERGVFNPDVPVRDWRQLYGALSEDIRSAAEGAGPEAIGAFNRANRYYRAVQDRSDAISSIVNRDTPEAIFQAATQGTKEGASTLSAMMKSLPEGSRKEVAAAVLNRMGRATSSNQNAAGDAFSTQTFLTNWNNLSPAARSALFNRLGPEFRSQVESITRVADNLRQGSKVFANPSGTGAAVTQAAGIGSLATAGLTGNYPVAGGILGSMAAGNLASRAMTSPNLVNWLGQQTQFQRGSGIQALLLTAKEEEQGRRRAGN